MIQVNIIRNSSSTLEYLYISNFFKLFGIPVYERLQPIQLSRKIIDNLSISEKEMEKYIDNIIKKNMVNIFINDNWEYPSFILCSIMQECDIVICGLNNSKSYGLKFPEKYKSNDNYSYQFFREIIDKIYKKYNYKKIQCLEDSDDMINFYLDMEILEKIYIPSQFQNYTVGFYQLTDKCMSLLNSDDNRSLNVRYAIANLATMLNYISYVYCGKNKVVKHGNTIVDSEIILSYIFSNLYVKIKGTYFPLIDDGRLILLRALIAYSDKTYPCVRTDRWLSEYIELYKNDDYFVRGLLADFCHDRSCEPVRERYVLEEILRLNPNDHASYFKLALLYNDKKELESYTADIRKFDKLSKRIGGYGGDTIHCLENALTILRTRFLLNNYELQDITYYILCMDFYNEIQHGHVTSFTGYQVDELMHRLDRNEFFYKLPDFLWCDCNKSHEYVKKN